MTTASGRATLYVQFEGPPERRRPVWAQPRAPRSGIKVRVVVEEEALGEAQVYLLVRRGAGDMVLGGSVRREALEEARGKLGTAASAYVIAAVPVLRSVERGR
ncbi:MAG: hypothetical protein NVSMB23_23900 [Myxococcales bacterium]